MIKNLKFISFNSKKKTNELVFVFSRRISSTIGRTFLSSIMVMVFFAVTPIFIKFLEEEILFSEFENNSRKVMIYKLSGKENLSVKNEENLETFDEKDLLSDILVLNELENNSVRLNTPTILQLFKDTKYNLEDVRNNKLVRPVALTWLPYEIKKIQNTKKRKDLFI